LPEPIVSSSSEEYSSDEEEMAELAIEAAPVQAHVQAPLVFDLDLKLTNPFTFKSLINK
jgi:hypothetical protein